MQGYAFFWQTPQKCEANHLFLIGTSGNLLHQTMWCKVLEE